MKIGVIGSGYVGLVVGACLADAGHEVMLTDSDEGKRAILKEGRAPFFEPGLDEILETQKHRIQIARDIEILAQNSEVIFLCVGTPEKPDGSPDLNDLLRAGELAFRHLTKEATIVIKSTVPVGTAKVLSRMAKELKPHPIHIVSNPEFLKQGSAIEDFQKPDRVVFGIESEGAKKIMEQVYAPIIQTSKAEMIFMDHNSAELTKYAANSFLALKISFINELAHIAEKSGADISSVKKGFTSDQRINPSFFNPGIGFGGSCFPKDLRALIHLADQENVESHLLKAALQVNDLQSEHFIAKIKQVLKSLDGVKLGVLGLSFKPKTDDIRRAPAIEIINKLLRSGARVKAFDPIAMKKTALAIKDSNFSCAKSAAEVFEDSTAVLVLTEWPEFLSLDLNLMKSKMKSPVIFDGRNLFDAQRMISFGFQYYGVGRSFHSLI